MTPEPKDKAKQLQVKFFILADECDGATAFLKGYQATAIAKECAKRCVDEIISSIDWHEFETPNKELDYWNAVKNEISLL